MPSPIQPDDDTARGLAERSNMMSEARRAGPLPGDKPRTAPAAPAKPAVGTFPMDKVNKGKYGSKAPEKRLDVSEALRPLGSFKKGTDYVPKTGNYTLHEGEKVVPKEKNMSVFDKVNAVGDSKKPKKEIKEIRTRKTHDGKYIHTHEHHSPMHHPNEEHVSNNMDEMKKHMEMHMGDGGEGAPMTAAPSPMPEAAPDAGAGGAANPAM